MANDTLRSDYLWAAVAARLYLEGIHAGDPPDQCADAAVKRADQAEDIVPGASAGNGARRLDIVWALVAAEEFNRLLAETIQPDSAAIGATADRAVAEVSRRPSIGHLLKSG